MHVVTGKNFAMFVKLGRGDSSEWRFEGVTSNTDDRDSFVKSVAAEMVKTVSCDVRTLASMVVEIDLY